MRSISLSFAVLALFTGDLAFGQVHPVTYTNVGNWPNGNIVMVVTPRGIGGNGTPMTQMYAETSQALIDDPIFIDINYDSGSAPSQIVIDRWSYVFSKVAGSTVYRCSPADTVDTEFTIGEALQGRDPCDPAGIWCSNPHLPTMGGTGIFELRLDYAGSSQTTLLLGTVRIISPDINGDGVIDLADNGLFAADKAAYNIRSDFVYNGVIDLADVGFFAAHYGDSCP